MPTGVRVQINSRPAILEMKVRLPQLRLQRKGGQFSLKARPPQLDQRMAYPEVRIDQTEAFASLERHGIYSFARKQVAAGRAAVQQAVARWTRDGDLLADPRSGVTIPKSAEKVWERGRREVNVDYLPKAPPKIDVLPGRVEFQFIPGAVKVDKQPETLRAHLSWGHVECRLVQRPMVELSVVGQLVDRTA